MGFMFSLMLDQMVNWGRFTINHKEHQLAGQIGQALLRNKVMILCATEL